MTASKGKEQKVETQCGICDLLGHCKKWSNLAGYECKSDNVRSLVSRLGYPGIHEFIECPPLVLQKVTEREASEACRLPWPMDAKHAFLGPEIGNNLGNMISVWYLLKKGAEVYVHTDGCDTMHYRVTELQDIINQKI